MEPNADKIMSQAAISWLRTARNSVTIANTEPRRSSWSCRHPARGRRRCRADARCPRPLASRSPPPRPPRGSADRNRVEQNALHDRAQPARASLALHRLLGDSPECLVGKGEIDALHLEQPLVLFDQGVLGLGQDAFERSLVEVLESVAGACGRPAGAPRRSCPP